MPRILSGSTLVVLLILLVSSASAQNPFLQNRGKRTLESIRFEGNEITRDYVLRRELGFAEGDEYDPELMTQAWERLEQLDFIAYVEIETERPGPGRASLIVRVVEEPRFRWSLGIEYERRHEEAVLGQFGFGWMNLRGRGESLDVALEAWKRRGARLTWTNPWVMESAQIGVHAGAHWQRYNWVHSPFEDTLFTRWGFEAGLTRALEYGFRVSATGLWQELQFDASDHASGALALGAKRAISQDPALILEVEHDGRDARYYPRQGIYSRARISFAGFGNDFDNYTITDLHNSAFVDVPKFAIVGGFLGYRMASTNLPLHETTYFGGPMSIRGIDFGSVRGDEHLRASIEVRRPIAILPLREGRAIGLGVHAFHDWGKAWFDGESHDDHPVHHSAGLGAHFSFNTHNYRFEWAHTEDGDNVYVFEDSFHF